MTETYFLPCSPRPFWPYSSAPQRHKWRHPVSCREWGKRENYNKEMEISDLELNDNRGSATSVQNDRWWKNQCWGQSKRKTESGRASFRDNIFNSGTESYSSQSILLLQQPHHTGIQCSSSSSSSTGVCDASNKWFSGLRRWKNLKLITALRLWHLNAQHVVSAPGGGMSLNMNKRHK